MPPPGTDVVQNPIPTNFRSVRVVLKDDGETRPGDRAGGGSNLVRVKLVLARATIDRRTTRVTLHVVSSWRNADSRGLQLTMQMVSRCCTFAPKGAARMSFEKALAEEIERIKAQLERLLGLSGTPGTRRGRKQMGTSKAKAAPGKTARKTSPKQRAQRKLQGAYMGHVRRLTPAQKKQVSAIREKSGYGKAIAMAKKLGRETND